MSPLSGETVVGCFRLEPRAPEDGAWPSDAPVTYLYSLAVRRDVAGSGVGRGMLQRAWEIASAQGSAELRLDCYAGNTKLRDLLHERRLRVVRRHRGRVGR